MRRESRSYLRFELRSISSETRVLYWLSKTIRRRYGRALLAWCLLLAAAPAARAQFPDRDGPPAGMDPERESRFVDDESILSERDRGLGQLLGEGDSDSGPIEGDVGPQVSSEFGAPYGYTDDQGLPYVMQKESRAAQPGAIYNPDEPPPPPWTYRPCMTRLGFRHSYTHGRNVGWGLPLVGTSWLNRPYYVGVSLGQLWTTNRVTSTVPGDYDVIGSVYFGCDWDYYWGSEFQYAYSTPELHNTVATDSAVTNRLSTWNFSCLYYPWGDSKFRPYWRFGLGDAYFDIPTTEGTRRNERLWATPYGIGLQYPLRPWLASRIELTDYLAWGAHDVNTQHLLTLNFGLEFRFGSKRKAYWPWNPDSKVW